MGVRPEPGILGKTSQRIKVMDCREVAEELYLYLDRELAPDEVRQVARHLQRCPGCFELTSFESGVMKLIRRDCGAERAPEELKQRLSSLLLS